MVDITGAANRLQSVGYNGYSPGRNRPGYCLQWVNLALLQGLSSVGPHAGQYGTAMDAWNYGTQNHPGDTNVPKDFPAYFGPSPTRTDSDAGAGDVVISNGDGRFVCTDGAGGGVVGLMTLQQRMNQISRPYLGWGGEQCGYAMTSTSGGGGGKQEDEMGDLSFIQDAQSPALYLQNNSTGKRVHIQSPYHVTLLQRAIAGDGGMLLAEMDIVNNYEFVIGPSTSVATIPALTAAQLAAIAAGVKVPVPASSLNIQLTGKATS